MEYTINADSVYPQGWLEFVPPGYDYHFRPPKKGDLYLALYVSEGRVYTRAAVKDHRFPSIVLTPRKYLVVKFTETGEVRKPKKGEWFRTTAGHVHKAFEEYNGAYSILAMTEEYVDQPGELA